MTAGGHHPGQHHRARADPVPDDRRHRAPARLRPRRPAGAQRDPGLPCSARTRSTRWSRRRSSPRRRWRSPPRRPTTPTSTGIIAAEVASELISRVAGKRLATTVGRRVPVVGGRRRRGRRRLRDLAGSAATPTASSCPRAERRAGLSRHAAAQLGADPVHRAGASGSGRRAGLGRSSRPARPSAASGRWSPGLALSGSCKRSASGAAPGAGPRGRRSRARRCP